MADVYHTFFGIAGLSLMGQQGLAAIDPTYALPVKTVQRLKQQQQRREAGSEQGAGE
jgi:geranylgeranyl transferase type-2 subunit beta